jgi:hypothetical protein
MSMVQMKSRSQGIALSAILAAVYVAFALIAGYLIGNITHGVENFIVRSLLFVILAGLTVGFGYSTIMGGISGLLLEFTIPTPIPFYLLPSLFAYGLVFDLATNLNRAPNTNLSTLRVLLATILASAAMSVVALTVFTLAGFFPPPLLPIIWGLEITTDVVLGVIGAVIGLALVRQLRHLKP